LHCLRHSFAVGTLLRWHREGVDPMSRLLDLSTLSKTLAGVFQEFCGDGQGPWKTG
jgi:hypothetical protein